jgi:hypothetical protein
MAAERADLKVPRKVDTREVVRVLARTCELIRLLRRATQERGADPRPLEQHGDSGAERPGPDDRGAAWMLAGVADGRRS